MSSRFRSVLYAMLLGGMICGVATAQATVELGFQGPGTLTGPEGSYVSGSYFATLTQLSGTSGAQGWSIIMDAENAEFTGITIAGTTADGYINREPCFGLPTCSFETYQMGCGMACSAVVLDYVYPTTLPPSGTSTIVSVDVQAEVPACGGQATLSYVDADGCFAGAANTNVVTIQGQSVSFANGNLSQVPMVVELVSETPCDPATLVEALIAQVQGIEAPAPVKTVLCAILNVALRQIEKGHDGVAIGLLKGFRVAVAALSGDVIPVEDADALIAAATAIIDILSEG